MSAVPRCATTSSITHAQISESSLAAAVDVLNRLAAVDTEGLTATEQSGYDGADSLMRHIRIVAQHLQPQVLAEDETRHGRAEQRAFSPVASQRPDRADALQALSRLHSLSARPAPEPLTRQTMATLDELAARKVLSAGREISALEAAAERDPWDLLRNLAVLEARTRRQHPQAEPQNGEVP